MGNFLSVYQRVGGGFRTELNGRVTFFRRETLRSTVLETDVYPGFSTDWQQPFAVLLTQAKGMSVIHETVYEDRLGYLDTLNYFGARTQTTSHCLGNLSCRYKDLDCRHSALILGQTELHSPDKPVIVSDLRAGLAFIIAAAIANGETLIENAQIIERGYGDLSQRLSSINLNIKRSEEKQIF